MKKKITIILILAIASIITGVILFKQEKLEITEVPESIVEHAWWKENAEIIEKPEIESQLEPIYQEPIAEVPNEVLIPLISESAPVSEPSSECDVLDGWYEVKSPYPCCNLIHKSCICQESEYHDYSGSKDSCDYVLTDIKIDESECHTCKLGRCVNGVCHLKTLYIPEETLRIERVRVYKTISPEFYYKEGSPVLKYPVQIYWDTNLPTRSKITITGWFSDFPAGNTTKEFSSISLSTSHEIKIKGGLLTFSSPYRFKIEAKTEKNDSGFSRNIEKEGRFTIQDSIYIDF